MLQYSWKNDLNRSKFSKITAGAMIAPQPARCAQTAGMMQARSRPGGGLYLRQQRAPVSQPEERQ
jgi:hypothetical protein